LASTPELHHTTTTPSTPVSTHANDDVQLMRQAANVLSSAPAMQIRYLETMAAMAKTANSKVSHFFKSI
jgi:hypothetical protein